MTYEEARDYIAGVSKTGSILGLTSIQNLMKELNDVQDKLSVIHIAGTNGKGSVGTYLEEVLIEAGKKVGRYTSPAVFSPLEVWRINRENITEQDYAVYLTRVRDACERMEKKGFPYPTVFEVETAMAFLYFYEKKCDYVLLEVGMGGATDATNLIQNPVCSVLTSISMDHMKFLGDTLEQIAGVKAGIIKEGCPVVSAQQKPDAMRVISDVAEEKHARLLLADMDKISRTEGNEQGIRFDYKGIGTISLQMSGECQIENACLAITVLQEVLKLPKEAIQNGLAGAKWPGRFETVLTEPLFIIDGAHNEDAAEKLSRTVQNYFTNRRITYIIGVLADKEHEKMLKKMLPMAERVYTVTPENIRALDGRILAEEAGKYHSKVWACGSVKEAVEKSLEGAKQEDVILAFGSLSYLGAVKEACFAFQKGTMQVEK